MRSALTAICAVLCLPVPGAAADFADDEAFFEFLGTFGDDDGNWLDPIELERLAAHAEATGVEDEATDDHEENDDDE